MQEIGERYGVSRQRIHQIARDLDIKSPRKQILQIAAEKRGTERASAREQRENQRENQRAVFARSMELAAEMVRGGASFAAAERTLGLPPKTISFHARNKRNELDLPKRISAAAAWAKTWAAVRSLPTSRDWSLKTLVGLTGAPYTTTAAHIRSMISAGIVEFTHRNGRELAFYRRSMDMPDEPLKRSKVRIIMPEKNTQMTGPELQSIATAVYGARWQSQLSRDMGIALRTVQRWARDGIDKPATSEGVQRFLEERRIARIAAPPGGSTQNDDRDDLCFDAVEPGITALIAAAETIGWARSETLSAIFALIISEIERLAGSATAIEMLGTTITQLRVRK
jgi:hypothetical protein